MSTGKDISTLRAQHITDTVLDSVMDLLYYHRQNDEVLAVGDIEEAIAKGEITIDDMVETFRMALTNSVSD